MDDDFNIDDVNKVNKPRFEVVNGEPFISVTDLVSDFEAIVKVLGVQSLINMLSGNMDESARLAGMGEGYLILVNTLKEDYLA